MRIIAVDDKPIPRRALVRAIEQADPTADVTECASAEDVLALPRLDAYDVAFIDIDMPGMSGMELARRLKAMHPTLNIVFATGYSDYMADAFALHSSGYLMKPITADKVLRELQDLRHRPLGIFGDDGKLSVRCFGDFEAFSHGQPVSFSRTRTKELLAYLVDRCGSVVSLHSVEAALWGDSRRQQVSGSYLRTLVTDLRRSLEACGHPDVLVRRYGELGIDTTKVSCDYYALLAGDPMALSSWRGEYMSQYSWAEATKAQLVSSLSGKTRSILS